MKILGKYFKGIMKKTGRILMEYAMTVLFLSMLSELVIYIYTGALAPDFKKLITVISVLSILMLFLMKKFIKYMGDRRYLKSPLSRIDKMSGEEFEVYLKVYFENNGYKVEQTPASNDYGADLICENKDGVMVVQAKRYDANVGTAAVQEIVAAREYYNAERCLVVTNSYFTRNAKSLAEANDVELWDRDDVCKKCKGDR